MKQINYYLYKNFSNNAFKGNTSAIILLEDDIDYLKKQIIALEINQPICCFAKIRDNSNIIDIECFNKNGEINYINHSFLSIIKHFSCNKDFKDIIIQTSFGVFNGFVENDLINIKLPLNKSIGVAIPDRLSQIFNSSLISVQETDDTCVIEMRNIEEIINLKPDFNRIAKLEDYNRVIVTCELNNQNIDYVYRYFAPKNKVNESFASLYAQTVLASFWQKILNKDQLNFAQASNLDDVGTIDISDNFILLKDSCIKFFEGILLI